MNRKEFRRQINTINPPSIALDQTERYHKQKKIHLRIQCSHSIFYFAINKIKDIPYRNITIEFLLLNIHFFRFNLWP